jgi:hypothetical protein
MALAEVARAAKTKPTCPGCKTRCRYFAFYKLASNHHRGRCAYAKCPQHAFTMPKTELLAHYETCAELKKAREQNQRVFLLQQK